MQAMEFSPLTMEGNTLANSLITREKEREFMNGQTEDATTEAGKMENKMELGSILTQMERKK